MSNLQFMIFEDDKENSQAKGGLVNKAKESKLKTLNVENIEVKHSKYCQISSSDLINLTHRINVKPSYLKRYRKNGN